jgi:hypothetical protein
MTQIIGVPELVIVAVLSVGAYFAYRVVRLLNLAERKLDR